MLAVLALSSDTAIHSATDFPSDSMARNCIDMSKTCQPVGDKGKGKDKGKDIGKVKGKADAKASAEDTGRGKHMSDPKAVFFRERDGYRYAIHSGICLHHGHECYGGKPTHFSCGLIFAGSLESARRARAKAKEKAKAKAELVEVESDDVMFHSSDAEW